MATYYCRSDGSDTAPYDTWAKAATDPETIDLIGIDYQDTVYVDHALIKEVAASYTVFGSLNDRYGGATWIVVDSTGDPEPPLASDYSDMVTGGGSIAVTSGNLNFYDSGRYYGFHFKGSNGVVVQASYDESIRLIDCRLECTSADDSVSFNSIGEAVMIGGSLAWPGTSSDDQGGILLNGQSNTQVVMGPSMIGADYKTSILQLSGTQGFTKFVGIDFANWGVSAGSVTLLSSTSLAAQASFIGCVMPTNSFSFGGITTRNGSALVFNRDANPSDADMWSGQGNYERWGAGISGRAVYRNAGPTFIGDSTAYCLRFVAANKGYANECRPFQLPIYVPNETTGATVTLTLELLVGKTSAAVDPLDNADVWIDVAYYGSASNGLMTVEETRSNSPLTAPTTLTTSTEEWTTTDAEANTAKYKIEHTTASVVQKKGPILVTVNVAGYSTNDSIYICPKIDLS